MTTPYFLATFASASVLGPGIDSANLKNRWSSTWQKYCDRNISCVAMIFAPALRRLLDQPDLVLQVHVRVGHAGHLRQADVHDAVLRLAVVLAHRGVGIAGEDAAGHSAVGPGRGRPNPNSTHRPHAIGPTVWYDGSSLQDQELKRMASHTLAPFPPELLAAKKQIREQARAYGLDFYPTIFEMCDYEQMNQIAAYGGFPQRYPHWRFGMEYEQLRKTAPLRAPDAFTRWSSTTTPATPTCRLQSAGRPEAGHGARLWS